MANTEVIKISVSLKDTANYCPFYPTFHHLPVLLKNYIFWEGKKTSLVFKLKDNLFKIYTILLNKGLVSIYIRLQIANILVVIVPRDTCKRYVFKNDTTR